MFKFLMLIMTTIAMLTQAEARPNVIPCPKGTVAVYSKAGMKAANKILSSCSYKKTNMYLWISLSFDCGNENANRKMIDQLRDEGYTAYCAFADMDNDT